MLTQNLRLFSFEKDSHFCLSLVSDKKSCHNNVLLKHILFNFSIFIVIHMCNIPLYFGVTSRKRINTLLSNLSKVFPRHLGTRFTQKIDKKDFPSLIKKKSEMSLEPWPKLQKFKHPFFLHYINLGVKFSNDMCVKNYSKGA